MKIKTSRFGEIDVDGSRIIFMPEGILGFPACKRFVMVGVREDSPFAWLQGVDDPDLAFILMDPFALKKDFNLPLCKDDMSDLRAREPGEITFFLIVMVRRGEPPCIVANMRGPIAINRETFMGKQLVLHASEIPLLAT